MKMTNFMLPIIISSAIIQLIITTYIDEFLGLIIGLSINIFALIYWFKYCNDDID